MEEMEPLVQMGAVVAFSFAGYLASNIRSRRRLPPRPPPHSDKEAATSRGFGGFKDGLKILSSEEAPLNVIHGSSICSTPSTPVSRDFDINTEKKLETRDVEKDQEMSYLRNLAQSLIERERNLETEMLEYYGLKEQEAAVRELENQLKMNSFQTKFLSLKVESLEDENTRLKSQVMEHARMKAKLESTKAKIKLLKRRLRSDGEHAKEKIASLRESITMLMEKEHKDAAENAELESKLKRVKELEEEAAELRKLNSRLEEENLDLAHKLEAVKMVASSTLRSHEVKPLEEVDRLRESNDKLMKEIERLRTDHSTDVEELVYLRWLNACLRYELKNCQPPLGKTIARDLSNTSSHKSEEKVKQLILEYTNTQLDVDTATTTDLCFDISSSSQVSFDEISTVSTKSRSNKSKFLSKLKKLVVAKGNKGSSNSSSNNNNNRSSMGGICSPWESSGRLDSASSYSIDDVHGRKSFDSNSSCFSLDQASVNAARSKSDVGDCYYRRVFNSRISTFDPEDYYVPEKDELHMFAQALRGSSAAKELGNILEISHVD